MKAMRARPILRLVLVGLPGVVALSLVVGVLALRGPAPGARAADDGPAVIATIGTGPGGLSPWVVAVNPSTNLIYAANRSSNNVSVIDGATNTVVGTPVPVGDYPYGVAANPNTDLIYVTIPNTNNVSVIDGATNTVVGTPVPVGTNPHGVAVNPSTNLIYVANYSSNNVSVIDGATNTVVGTPVPVGSAPISVAANPDTNRIYVTNRSGNSVSVIDGATNAVVGTPVPVGANPSAVAVNPGTNLIYVENYYSNNVSVIDGATNTVVATVGVGMYPCGVAVNLSTNRIYVTNYSGNNVSVIDGATNTVVATPAVQSHPWGVADNPSTNRIYVANSGTNTVSVIEDLPGPTPTPTSTSTPTPTEAPIPPGTLVVADDGLGSASDCNSGDAAYSTIQAAIDTAASGDTILVCPGTYAHDEANGRNPDTGGARQQRLQHLRRQAVDDPRRRFLGHADCRLRATWKPSSKRSGNCRPSGHPQSLSRPTASRSPVWILRDGKPTTTGTTRHSRWWATTSRSRTAPCTPLTPPQASTSTTATSMRGR